MMQPSDLTSEQLDKLEEIAKAATPGPWRVEMGATFHGPSGNARNHVLTSSPTDQHWSHGTIAVSAAFLPRDAENWAHIAAASPDVVLALVAAVRCGWYPAPVALQSPIADRATQPSAEPLTEEQLGWLERDIREWWPSDYRGGGWGDYTSDVDRRAAQDRLFAVAASLVAAAKALPEWRADSERLRAERAQVREVMGASPAEGHIEAARRVVGERDRLRTEAERIAGTSLGAMRREVAQLRERVAALMGDLARHRDERDRLAAELTKWQRRAEEARAEATSSLVTGFCAELAAALELPAGSGMDDITAEVSRLAGGGWLEMRHEVERLRTALAAALEAPPGSTADELIEMARLCRSVAQLRGVRKNPSERGPHRCDGCQIFRRHDAELRAEVERLRGLGLEAVELGEGQMPYPAAATRFREIRVELEHKP